jgi:hypothetical protein
LGQRTSRDGQLFATSLYDDPAAGLCGDAPAATLDLAGCRGAGTPGRHAVLRHDATRHIVPMYQLDISGRQFAVARPTRELR